MKTEIEQVKYMRDDEGFWLRIRIPPTQVAYAMNELNQMGGKKFDLEIKQHREHRSLDANSYFWVLCGKLAAKTGQPRESIYLELVKNIGDNYQIICCQDRAKDRMKELWGYGQLGWVVDELPSKVKGCTNLMMYYGSSTYDTAQMSRLIDAVVSECKEQGIETATPEELARIKEEWGRKNEKYSTEEP